VSDENFSAEWLALRAAADARARADNLIERAAALLSVSGTPAAVTDLGAGTGATLRALSPRLPLPQRWTLVDADAALLSEAERLFAAAPVDSVSVTTRACDLSQAPAPWDEPPGLVTASALFDLASAGFIARFAGAAAADRVPVLAMLTYDGVIEAAPAHPLDAEIREAFNRHQKGEKAFGPAAGPDAPARLRAAFAAHGYAAEEAASPWRLAAGADDALIAASVEGIARAAGEILPGRGEEVAAWRAARLTRTDALVVGHCDQLFVPPGRRG